MALAPSNLQNIGKVLSALQPSIGQLPDKNSQDAAVAAAIKPLGLKSTKAMRDALGRAARENNISGYRLEYVFTRRAEEVFRPEFLQQIGYQSVAPSDQEARESTQGPEAAQKAGISESPASATTKQTPLKLKIPKSKTQPIVLESPLTSTPGSEPTAHNVKPSGKRTLETLDAEPPPKRPKLGGESVQETTTQQVAAQDNQAPSLAFESGLAGTGATRSVRQAAGQLQSQPSVNVSSSLKRKQGSSDSIVQDEAPEQKRRRQDNTSSTAAGSTGQLGSSREFASFGAHKQHKMSPTEASDATANTSNIERLRGKRLSDPLADGTQKINLEAQLSKSVAQRQELEEQLNAMREELQALKAKRNDNQGSSQKEDQEIEDLRQANSRLKTLRDEASREAWRWESKLYQHASPRSMNIPEHVRIAGRKTNEAQNDREQVRGIIGEDMETIYMDVKDIPRDYAADRKMNGADSKIPMEVQLSMDTKTATASQQEKLEVLYARIFGTTDWKRRWLEARIRPESYRFRFEEFITSLIGAGVYEAVLSRSTPWDLRARVKESLGDTFRYMEGIRAEVRIEESLKFVQYAMIQEGRFDDEINAHARNLCNDLADTLMPQLDVWKAQQVRQFGSIGDAKVPLRWLTQLENVIRKALKVKLLAETFDDRLYDFAALEFVWLDPGYEAHGVEAKTFYDKYSNYSQKIQYTMWPGVRFVLKGRLFDPDKGSDDVRIRIPVRVVSVDIKPSAEEPAVSDHGPNQSL